MAQSKSSIRQANINKSKRKKACRQRGTPSLSRATGPVVGPRECRGNCSVSQLTQTAISTKLH